MSANQRTALQSFNLYTITVICAIPIERAAVRATLEAQHARFGLMVCIGAAIPQQDQDIRLGDVPVSRPTRVQYDFVKAVPGQPLQRMGFLNAPPAVLSRAVSSLRSVHEDEATPSHMPVHLARMPAGFGHPGPSHD
ncbi:hypothetical protein B0T25DRAFT_571163 [Lasiosphaeria hispida]|uniref:Uncharacterized protein n=1 Tax=Lasiosphaeria hispida TaxID=260671 RepID=A0AAJ0HAZ4_9PEZI|nr:hypothetical protein B0T25DRAFT_571163 [Lasiosphaeria hispida]